MLIDTEGPAAPPRSNGEFVFAEPWESRAFGMVIALLEQELFTWDQFQAALIARIARWHAGSQDGKQWSYYQHWIGALEDVLAACGSVLPGDVSTRVESLARRAAGHDHAH